MNTKGSIVCIKFVFHLQSGSSTLIAPIPRLQVFISSFSIPGVLVFFIPLIESDQKLFN
jgi:hypothetical protein